MQGVVELGLGFAGSVDAVGHRDVVKQAKADRAARSKGKAKSKAKGRAKPSPAKAAPTTPRKRMRVGAGVPESSGDPATSFAEKLVVMKGRFACSITEDELAA
eukprot:4518771-Alexandrium_andersonii.AAC.1